ncbi:MAG TPA: hypothetical protein VMI13_06485 [Solirubrobacteraceae bacterium]|nr:hypothetical protein [Solirubrobacteraceae bacterium]
MIVTPRMLLASIAASATLGGGVGALAAAATTSQASPAAIAAAAQKVKDSSAENSLAAIQREVGRLTRISEQTCTYSYTGKYGEPACGGAE